MSIKLKTIMKTFFLLCVLVSTSILPHQKNPDKKPFYAIPPPEFSNNDVSYIISLDVAYTFFVANQQNMIYVNTDLISHTLSENPIFIPKNWIEEEVDGKSGFKAGLGFNTFHDGWTVFCQYLYYNNDSPPKDHFLEITKWKYQSSWLYPMDTFLNTFSSEFTNQFNRIDLTMQRQFFAGNYLLFSPFVGLLSAWERQYLTLSGHSINQDADNQDEISETYQTKKFWSIGPYAGIHSSYFFTRNWAITGNFGVSIFYANNKTYARFTPIKSNDDEIAYITKNDYQSADPMFDASLGVRWDTTGEHFLLKLCVLWELQTWFNHNTFIRLDSMVVDGFTNSALPYNFVESTGNFSLQGLVCKLSLFF